MKALKSCKISVHLKFWKEKYYEDLQHSYNCILSSSCRNTILVEFEVVLSTTMSGKLVSSYSLKIMYI